MDVRRVIAVLLVLIGALILADWQISGTTDRSIALHSLRWPLPAWLGLASVILGVVLTVLPRRRW